jgi:acetyl-CoA carboxylase carboxyl transferase subunit beta
MGWFSKTEEKRPARKKEELWTVCPGCKAHVYKDEWRKGLNVCPKCAFHDRITYQQRIELLIDKGSYEELHPEICVADPLRFSDGKSRFADKAAEAVTGTGMRESIVTGCGKIHGIPVVIGVMDFRFLGGSLGSGTGEKILLATQHALRYRVPCIVVAASGGARMQEGTVSLMQMAKTCAGIARLNKAGVPYVSVLTHPTTGGVSASYAMVGDVNIAEPGVMIGFAGRRVIEQTIKQKLPDDFQTAEYLLAHGFVDCIVSRAEMKDFLHRLLSYWNRG